MAICRANTTVRSRRSDRTIQFPGLAEGQEENGTQYAFLATMIAQAAVVPRAWLDGMDQLRNEPERFAADCASKMDKLEENISQQDATIQEAKVRAGRWKDHPKALQDI
ncbi:hypothetical protein FDECE_17719 [Fusarium decemcellulare]|nr:hypothetical protein FDECE_17719 [Fusarium decemcellulare]